LSCITRKKGSVTHCIVVYYSNYQQKKYQIFHNLKLKGRRQNFLKRIASRIFKKN